MIMRILCRRELGRGDEIAVVNKNQHLALEKTPAVDEQGQKMSEVEIEKPGTVVCQARFHAPALSSCLTHVRYDESLLVHRRGTFLPLKSDKQATQNYQQRKNGEWPDSYLELTPASGRSYPALTNLPHDLVSSYSLKINARILWQAVNDSMVITPHRSFDFPQQNGRPQTNERKIHCLLLCYGIRT